LIYKLINILHVNLIIPVTAKFRVFPTIERTVEYAKMLERAGAQIITCHGRIREQRGQNTGLADWDKIRAVKEAVSIPVFANGNILYQSDIDACLKATGADGVMSAEGQLYNPALFAGIERPYDSTTYDSDSQILERHPRHADLALEYLSIVRDLKSVTSVTAIKGHLFKIMRPGLIRESDLQEKLGRVKINQKKLKEELSAYTLICEEMKVRMERDEKAVEGVPIKDLISVEPITGIPVMPHWLARPYFRPLPEQKKAFVKSQSEDRACKLKSKRPLDDVSNENEEVKKTRTTSDVDVSPSDSAVLLVTI